jgi:hypothetical protein
MKLMGYFKRPVALPSDIWREIQGEQETDMGITIFCKPSSKPCLQISLSRVSAS